MKDDLKRLLQSERPSRRSVGIDRLRREATPADVKLVRAAMTSETVPALRRQLSHIARALDQAHAPSTPIVVPAEEGRVTRLEDDFIHWMRHELEPGIGWLALAASDEIGEFETSETRAAIDGMAKRLDSVEALVRASAPPRYEPLSLSEALHEAIQISRVPTSRVAVDAGRGGPDGIMSDPNLLRLLLSNAIRNGYEAVLEVAGDNNPQVYVASGVTPQAFWVNISNRFSGAEFSLDEVSGRGVSAKIGHQGQGFGIMRIVAARLGYELQMEAEAGLAIFSLKGRRSVV
ncbi:GHKL domain-containing protein [Cellulomonas cellasea]|uniref:GHKL domain-containing protein n=1 Tax=Cellulomonas cellasea TaxID=43670 RepID=UPI0025A3ED46|nr:GHKL domain-containing protein [Cellulomonas cellasea]MDM8083316.1 GHKL domain-containing protein [Cellulomonas cellasea]